MFFFEIPLSRKNYFKSIDPLFWSLCLHTKTAGVRWWPRKENLKHSGAYDNTTTRQTSINKQMPASHCLPLAHVHGAVGGWLLVLGHRAVPRASHSQKIRSEMMEAEGRLQAPFATMVAGGHGSCLSAFPERHWAATSFLKVAAANLISASRAWMNQWLNPDWLITCPNIFLIETVAGLELGNAASSLISDSDPLGPPTEANVWTKQYCCFLICSLPVNGSVGHPMT